MQDDPLTPPRRLPSRIRHPSGTPAPIEQRRVRATYRGSSNGTVRRARPTRCTPRRVGYPWVTAEHTWRTDEETAIQLLRRGIAAVVSAGVPPGNPNFEYPANRTARSPLVEALAPIDTDAPGTVTHLKRSTVVNRWGTARHLRANPPDPLPTSCPSLLAVSTRESGGYLESVPLCRGTA